MATLIMQDPADGFGADTDDGVGPQPGQNSSRPATIAERGDEEYDELGAGAVRDRPLTAAAYVWPM